MTRLLILSCCCLLSSWSAAAQLADPPDHVVLYRLRTEPTSVQIYTCKDSTWSLPAPDALVSNPDHTLVVHHYKGPVWEATDGSLVRGSSAKHVPARGKKSVDWLELTATNGTLKFARVDLIHRIDTTGGLPPSTPCDAIRADEQVRVPYGATYLFYVPK